METRESLEPGVAGGREEPGLALLGAQGQVRLATPSLLEHLGLREPPPTLERPEALLERAGFAPCGGEEGLWEREGQRLRVGTQRLGEATLLWTLPVGPSPAECQTRSRFLSLASHDLRGALANARSYAGLLLGGRLPLEAKVQRGLEIIARNVDRSLTLAQDFFDAARADLGTLAYEFEPGPLGPLLRRVVDRHQRAAADAGVQLALDTADGLPEVPMDGGRLERAVEALLQHQLSRAQTAELVWVRAGREHEARVQVEVRREGAPLPGEELALLFERETRAFRERKAEDALRLSLARQIARAHRGEVRAASDASGTSLLLTLPA